MNYKFLLSFFLLFCGILNAQEPYRSLVISEARIDQRHQAYIEITNMGEETVNLSNFEIGRVAPWNGPVDVEHWTLDDWFQVSNYVMLPDVDLPPNESFVVALVADWYPEMERINPYENNLQPNKKDIRELADFALHYEESSGHPADSVTPGWRALDYWAGYCSYLRHHYTDNDSAVIDQVGGVFDDENGTNYSQPYDVAGLINATSTSTLVRKSSITTGNLNFRDGRGTDLLDSEWIPIPHQGANPGRRSAFWTVGNHGDYILDQNTLVSSTLDIEWDNAVINVPWGTQRDDSLVAKLDRKEGLAWHYHYAPSFEDSAYLAARTGDTLTIYICGETMQKKNFAIVVNEPGQDDNIVVPKRSLNEDGYYGEESAGLYDAFCRVTDDTIKNSNNLTGIEFAMRKDTLFKYLQKPSNARLEIDWVDDIERADLKNGDILKVYAENGDVKEYVIWMDSYLPSHEAQLASITWPDIPGFYRGIFGWKGDTIPNFGSANFEYSLTIPSDIDGIPAMVASPIDLNAKVTVKRAKNLFGSLEDRTLTFTVTAEDDTTSLDYEVTMEKQLADTNVQPYHAEPFISEFIYKEQWHNGYVEICNPGNQVLDLSNYMFFQGYESDPSEVISGYGDWENRYRKYIPGYKWTSSEQEWVAQPYMVFSDLNVNPLVQPGDVFVLGEVNDDEYMPWFASEACDIDFAHDPWGEEYTGASCAEEWGNATFLMFKILNDSVKQGLKPATDPNDFEVIATFGSGDGTKHAPQGETLGDNNSFERKPEYFLPKAGLPSESWGNTPEESEWTMTNRSYFQDQGVGWPNDVLFIADGLGSHFFNQITIYKSKVTSTVYKVSKGYSHQEEIHGVITGTSVDDFKNNVIKADTGQVLTLKSTGDGSVLENTDILSNGDSLIVLSADSVNTTKYILNVTDEGLSDDAVLLSSTYTIEVDGNTGTISGFDYGTTLNTIIGGIELPTGASMQVIDDEGAYMPMKRLNFDTTYVNVLVNDQTFIEVLAEDGVTMITYAISPNAEPSDAIVFSSVYLVDQVNLLIDLVPYGTSVSALLNNLVPSRGATIKVVDKVGIQRTIGNIARDDKIVVTSQDSETINTYYLSLLGQDPNNLAYLLSQVYDVDQLTLTVYVPLGTSNPTAADLFTNLELAPGATVQLTDADGVNKADSELVAEDDLLKVTAGDGVNVTNYTVSFVTNINELTDNINIFPNPSSGLVNVSGLSMNSSLHVYNIVGNKVMEKVVRQNQEIISLKNQTSGVYFIVITNDNEIIGRYKLILK